MLGTLAMPLGIILGMSFGPIFVKNDDVKDIDAGKKHVETLMLVSAIVNTLMCLPVIVLYKEKPTHFPSRVA